MPASLFGDGAVLAAPNLNTIIAVSSRRNDCIALQSACVSDNDADADDEYALRQTGRCIRA